MYKTLDLFSGIGGLTYALAGVAEPVAYCDVDPICRAALTALFGKGLLPRAPILDDVRTLRREHIDAEVDMVTGGFPCVGLSPLGNRKGLQNEQSALFYELARVAQEFAPAFVFMENVPEVTSVLKAVHEKMNELGYDLRWCCLSAEAVGALHVRKRWFCLATKRGDSRVLDRDIDGGVAMPDWNEAHEPKRLEPDSKQRKQRLALLGNSVVPRCVRAAFFHLWNAKDEGTPCAQYMMHGCTRGAQVLSCGPPPINSPPPPLNLVFDPSAFSTGKPPSVQCKRETVTDTAVRRSKWSTLRHGMTGACNVLTKRSMRDLPTQVRFEKGTTGDRSWQMSAAFGEYLMGYPLGWTELI
ncbi:S-adenosyl-L-methionine-dependent methyltransferase [Tribonema minus]|uniref:S-adenosyl-L-methionine-dependent methyltransferase n=1 Tax=Tribonema minus TaxID=303371 RepID=A0A835YX27_9STRA|nr:S-adenosyl-L-methionine-dependent methyltransferase [Tribonema minus]